MRIGSSVRAPLVPGILWVPLQAGRGPRWNPPGTPALHAQPGRAGHTDASCDTVAGNLAAQCGRSA
eukprot:9149231-Pyramimonas_sp.AAC.1